MKTSITPRRTARLIAAALGTLCCATSLQAQTAAPPPPISIFGRLDVSVGRHTEAESVDVMSGFNTPSVFGVIGSRELVPGITGKFRLETGNIAANGSIAGRFFGRAAWAGVAGDFGEVRAGRIASIPFQTALAYDLNGASDASAYINAGISPILVNNLGSRRDRQLQYLSPKFGGLRVLAGLTPKDSSGALNSKAVGALGAVYADGPVSIGAVYESASRVDGGTDAGDKATKTIGGSVDFGVATVAFSAISAGSNPGFGATNKGLGAGVVVPVAGFNIGAQYARNSASGVGATELFINRDLFKGATAYLDYGQVSQSKRRLDGTRWAKDSYFSLGVIYTF